MATFFFDGTSSQTITFDVDADQVVFELNASDVVSITEGTNGTTLTTTSGNTLLFAGLTAAALADASILPESFLQFGTTDDEDEADSFVETSSVTGGVIFANDGEDSVVGGDAADLLYGNQGDDTLIGSGGSDRLFGGMGDDTITAQNSEDDADESALRIRGGNDTDTIVVGGVVDSNFDITTDGFEGAATIYGGNGLNDSADGGDSITVSLADDASAVIYGNGGEDEITVTGDGDATVFGGAGDDSINGAAGGGTGAVIGAGLVYGGLGEDTIEITTGDDTATIYGGNGANDTLDGADTITIDGSGDVVVYGNAGNDVIVLEGTGEATVFGGMGDDTIAGSADGADGAAVADNSSIVGGLGEDIINLTTAAGDEVVVYGGNGTNDTADGADEITVDGDGDVTIYGNGDDDQIFVDTTGGEVHVFGGAGEDVVRISDDAADITVNGGAGDDVFAIEDGALNAAPTADNVIVFENVNFDDDSFAFDTAIAGGITVASDLSDTSDDNQDAIDDAGTLADAADVALQIASGTAIADGAGVGVLFNYDGESYVAIGEAATGDTETALTVIQVTGFTGDFDAGSFNNGFDFA